MDKNEIASWFRGLQDEICNGLESLDGTAKFEEDQWERAGGGGGRTRIFQGENIEKGGVNYSAVHGQLSPGLAKALHVEDESFFATGVSIVLHPSNPMVPIIHMNVRYFETSESTWWFGGGIDVTPHYVFEEDAKFFHQYLKGVCDRHHPDYYNEHKSWADDYFFIKHRDETRGIGGIFFDKLSGSPEQKEQLFAYVQDVGRSLLPIYSKLYQAHSTEQYTSEQKEWQLIRRGRYVEFNLVWDRGTKFGLDTDGRTESILMSLPKDARWLYNHIPDEGTREAQTMQYLKKGMNWINQ